MTSNIQREIQGLMKPFMKSKTLADNLDPSKSYFSILNTKTYERENYKVLQMKTGFKRRCFFALFTSFLEL
jgi:hypothetical protein